MDNITKWSQWPADLHQQPDQIKRQFFCCRTETPATGVWW